MARTAKRPKGPIVVAVNKDETTSGFHEVIWSRSGNLNRAVQRGDFQRFRKWPLAKKLAREMGKELGVKPKIGI